MGEGPDKNAAAVAEEMGVDLTKQNGAQFFEDAVDIVYFDLLLAMGARMRLPTSNVVLGFRVLGYSAFSCCRARA